jgi:N utilization substance protein B
MRKRSRAREFALQVLYQLDITGDSPELALENFWQAHLQEDIDPESMAFTASLVKGTKENISGIDLKISQYAANWQLKRMAVIDRNIMRLSCYELIFCKDIPPKVSINEAVELAKKYSGPQAGKFVNAILDKVKLEKEK